MILIADDHDDTRTGLVRMFQLLGYQAIGVADGPQVLLFLKTTRPRLVILDYDMPGMDGIRVLDEMKASPRTADIPVVFFSASHFDVVGHRAIAHGAAEYIRKGSDDWERLTRCAERYLAPPAPPAPPATDECRPAPRRPSLNTRDGVQ